ncbi:MAG TPA: SEC-C metal-binding domain-containing protein [Polyangia bacterium]|nr:SEC-C metal-binding domain-containing protein [Polyangia bacterium]
MDARTATLANASTTGRRKKVGRNDPCACGSQKKYKKCCLLPGGRQ